MPISENYVKVRERIRNAKKRTLDRGQIGYWEGYITGLGAWDILNFEQVKKLGKLIRKGEY